MQQDAQDRVAAGSLNNEGGQAAFIYGFVPKRLHQL